MASEQLERRYTDQEVALVLQRTAELEERRFETVARGVTQREIESIAKEVGFGSEAVAAALAELRAGARLRSRSLLGPAPSAKRVTAVAGRLSERELPPLIQIVEDRIAAAGTVTEALGSVRWTSVPTGNHLAPVTQVSFTPGPDETQIQVSRRYEPRIRAVVNLLPGGWGGMIGLAVAASSGLAVLPALAVVVGSVAGGVAIGRAIWHRIARRNHLQVERLAAELAGEAGQLRARSAAEG